VGPALRKRQEDVPEQIKEIAWKAQVRLSKRYANWTGKLRRRTGSAHLDLVSNSHYVLVSQVQRIGENEARL
jgi:hypothetical protein